MSKVSIIIPVYNVEAYLRRCLDSVTSQTLKDLEILCIDDGSTDGSAAILQKYAAGDCRIKTLRREHADAGSARNAAIDAATGEFLAFVDADDWCELTLFEKAYAKAEADGADVVLWRHREVDEASGKTVREVAPMLPHGIRSPFDGTALKDKVFSTFNYAPWNRMVKRDFARRNKLAFQQIERSNDVSFGCLALAEASRISVIDEVLYNYRVRRTGNLQSENEKTPLSIIDAWKHLARELERRGLSGRYRAGTALASMYCFARTLDVLSDHADGYAALFGALKTLYEKDAFFATVKPEEINNDIMANTLRAIRKSKTFAEFAIGKAADASKWMGKFYREREQARKELKAMQPKRLPGVSILLVSDGDAECEAAFGKHVEEASISDFEIIGAAGISEDLLERAGKDYVAIVQANDRYVNEYALELLVDTARCEEADVVGGCKSNSPVRVADFVFDLAWLRQNADLLPVLRHGDRAFVAAAIGRAGRHVVRDRVYTEFLRRETEPPVSVVVPAYNAEQYLDRCLKSIVGQTHRNLEIIVVDDGSTDATAAIADGWAEKDARIKVIRKRNGGQSSARNAGMKIASGKYIGFVDADDYVEPDMFGDMAEALEDHPHCDMAKCGVAVEYTYKVPAAEIKSTQAYFANPANGEVLPCSDIVGETDVGPVDKLYRLDFLKGNGIEFPEGVKNEDEAFFFAVFCRCRNCFYLPGMHYHYLRNPEGTMARQMSNAVSGAIPDAVKVFYFIAEFLWRENRRDLLGVLYRHMVGFVQRFLGTPVENAVCDAVAGVLRKTDAFYYADLICGANRQWVQRRVFELMNRAMPCGLPRFDVPEAWFPSVPPPSAGSAQPLVSFIVPVYNVEKYIAAALESLRSQTLPWFEIVCIDDGSIDDSGKILDDYSRADSRIRVWHLENGGVSKARNFGLEKARGRYVAFVDGDDRLHPRMAEETVCAAIRDDLDAAMFDYRCFAYDTLKNIDHYWRLAHHANAFPQDRTFSPGELTELPVYGSSCTFLWKREFLRESGVRFPGMKLGEDLVWVLSVLAKVRRMRIVNRPFYEYRRGNPSSAVSRLQTAESDAPVLALKGLADVIAATPGRRLRRAMLNRAVSDILFYGEKFPKARAWLCGEGFDLFGGMECIRRAAPANAAARIGALFAKAAAANRPDIEYFIRQTPRKVQKIMRQAVADRAGTAKDLIIVAGQLNSTTNEPLDSWTFFRWLQDHGVPSRYVVWQKHSLLEKMRAENGLKDVVLLSGNGVDDYEFIEKCKDLLPRLKAVVMENTALNPMTWRYFHMLDGCAYVFLQHGVMFWKMASKIASSFAVANYVNVASESEKAFLEKYVPEHWETGRKPQYLVAGLPRWDLLKDESGGEREKTVFYMPTWRAMFNSGMDAIAKSAYFAGVRALVSEENVARLKRRNIRIVMAAHHHLSNHVKNLDFKLPVRLVPSSEVSYWIRHASLCVTDYSSVSFDFLFLDKPCIFWTPDRYDGLLSGDDYAEAVFAEHQEVNMFNRVRSPEEVVELIEKYADSGFRLEPEKRAVCDRYFSRRSGICRSLYEQIRAIGGKEADA